MASQEERLQDDEVVLQCSATIHKEQQKLCLAAEGFGNRLCFLESTSNSKNVPPDLSICTFVLEQSLSVRALQEMLANTEEKAEGASVSFRDSSAGRADKNPSARRLTPELGALKTTATLVDCQQEWQVEPSDSAYEQQTDGKKRNKRKGLITLRDERGRSGRRGLRPGEELRDDPPPSSRRKLRFVSSSHGEPLPAACPFVPLTLRST
ncbi:hypothetical protein SKAU_G00144350 [Synaphobranchus kaupii]|uniref:Inositol 1,4,5-trisphosphate/ryanodine receptor domain-containing protein n=1 Tax=Synaphobranchus kaupii TaxID=118154 RepID=A0A9Q1FTB2_SYNKA|nr:hypothetical protein SKAU_G00144350 [Synaphobranchus kaupii]